MIRNLSDKEYKELADAAEGQTLEAILFYAIPDDIPAGFSFEDRKEIFLWSLEKLLSDGRLKLAKHGQFLRGSTEQQVDLFRKALPKSEKEINDGLWFFDEDCPGGAVWVLSDGSLQWS
ncbi:MAG: DUF596 domain-containing protein [Klebsiella huaxiensis]|uniref:DUF596 domain-containing protein n=1 Tax=Klebsiella huaxiensis TaxID=2153354 RepID=UPI0026EDD710|nr:DUF596 domain-containing protein [Klebsiella huaxiensis]WEJ90906.1 MAG: DUF596 domain-containing protein [Klebsiella huaxiensis]